MSLNRWPLRSDFSRRLINCLGHDCWLLQAERVDFGYMRFSFPHLEHLLLDAESFRVAIALRIGADVCEPHVCLCGQMMDSRGLHGLSCRYSVGRHPRHTALNGVIPESFDIDWRPFCS